MRLGTVFGLAALAAAASMSGAQAQTAIYVYNFADAGASGTNSAANTAALFAVDRTAAGHAGGSALSSTFDPAFITNFAGSTVSADSGDAAGQALALQGGTGNGNNGAYLQATANLTGFSKINFSFATQATGTGFSSDQFQYSLNGTTFTNFGTAYAPATAFAVQSFDLSSITGLNNNANAAFRIVFNGATSASGNNRLDNLVISGTSVSAPAVPETSTTASFGLLLVLGLGATAVARRRRQA